MLSDASGARRGELFRTGVRLLILVQLLVPIAVGQSSRPTITIQNSAARLTIDLAGGSIVSFQLASQNLNPLVWNDSPPANAPPNQPRERGHFLCLDRWGQPSAAELKNGMPFHGEATKVLWTVASQPSPLQATITATLPMAGLAVTREFRLAAASAVVEVTETVTNRNPLSRPYNMVQHPTIGPPFLDESVLVDSNARRGFMQSSPASDPANPTVVWPVAMHESTPVNLRYLKDDPNPNVVSYVIEEAQGWVTAVNPNLKLLIGYSWDSSDYPWLNIWRHTAGGKPLARGLEFGTTGLHQPFPILARVGTIFGRKLFAYIDAGESQTRRYRMFLAEVPQGYQGVSGVTVSPNAIAIQERGADVAKQIQVAR